MIRRVVQSLMLVAITMAWAGELVELHSGVPSDGPQYCWSEVDEVSERDELKADCFLTNLACVMPEPTFFGLVRNDIRLVRHGLAAFSLSRLRGSPSFAKLG